MAAPIPSYIRRYQKRKDRIDYYLFSDPNGFRQLMQQLSCGYTGFMFPLERTDSKKYYRYRQFELATFEQREELIDKIYLTMRQSKLSMLRAKRMWQQILRQIKRERLTTTLSPSSYDLRIETKEQLFQVQLQTFLQQNQSIHTIDDLLIQLITNRSMFNALNSINDELKRWINLITEQNGKLQQDGERLFRLVSNENDLHIKFKLLTKLIRIGDDEQVVQAYWQRMLVCMQAGKYLTAAHDLDILLSQVCQQQSEQDLQIQTPSPPPGMVNCGNDVRLSQQLFYYAIKCYYRLLTNPTYKSLGSIKRENHLQRYQHLIRQLQLLAYFDYTPRIQRQQQQQSVSSQIVEFMRESIPESMLFRTYGSVLRRLKKEGLPVELDDILIQLKHQQQQQQQIGQPGIDGQQIQSNDNEEGSLMDSAKVSVKSRLISFRKQLIKNEINRHIKNLPIPIYLLQHNLIMIIVFIFVQQDQYKKVK